MRPHHLVFILASLPGSAAADVVPPPEPRECPAGSEAETSHCGTVCFARACTTDEDCAAGQRCAERPLCVEEVGCGGWGGTFPIVEGACGGGCTQGSCQSVRSCGPSADSDGGMGGTHTMGGCGCRAAGGPTPVIGLVVAAAVALSLRRRNRH